MVDPVRHLARAQCQPVAVPGASHGAVPSASPVLYLVRLPVLFSSSPSAVPSTFPVQVQQFSQCRSQHQPEFGPGCWLVGSQRGSQCC
jgi:hypothetical protein